MAWLSNHPQQFEKTLRILNYSGMIMLGWSCLQAVFALFFEGHYPQIMYQIQSLFNTRGLFESRITGFSFEPSWLAHQINLLFLPFWMAASIKRTSVHRFRLWKLTIENILLGVGLVVVFLSSRVGTLAVLLVIAFLAVRLHLRVLANLFSLLNHRMRTRSALLRSLVRVVTSTALISLLIFIYFLLLIGLVFILAHVDHRIASLFDLDAIKQNLANPYMLFNQFSFAERYVYWVSGWRIFNDYPLLGVGLGNAGLYFQKHLTSYSWVLPEVLNSYYRLPAVMNIKSFWVRLLAETGLAGFAVFLGWYVILWRTSRFLESIKKPLMSTIGLAGQLVLIAFIAEGFSTDTFALPYLWLLLGMVCSAGAIVRNSYSETGSRI
jgi:hypothetical protein